MKRNKWALFGLLVFLAGCAGGNTYIKIRIELPTYSNTNLEDFQEIVITNFLVSKEPSGISLSDELGRYFRAELERKFKGRVSLRQIPLESEAPFQKPETWKSLAGGSGALLILSGKAQLSRETRKSILGRRTKTPEGEYLPGEKTVEERQVFTLEATLYLIRGDTGEILLQKNFKETKPYAHPQQRADFAFFDLVQRVKAKLFQPMLGEERIQDRYLLTKEKEL